MAKEEIIIAGFGGQGVLSMGKILAYSGVMQDMEVSWMPSYGPEMRGGTANVTVILSDKPVSSPISHEYDTAIILNQQSLDKFEPLVTIRTVFPGIRYARISPFMRSMRPPKRHAWEICACSIR